MKSHERNLLAEARERSDMTKGVQSLGWIDKLLRDDKIRKRAKERAAKRAKTFSGSA